jgi:hypothetical protein
VLVPLAVLVCSSGNGWARQNILTGEISARYDYQERSYDEESLVAGPDVVAGDVSQPEGPTVIILEDRRGDGRSYILSPRLTLSSIGINDLLELTYAPGLNYDELYSETDVDHDFGLRAEKNLTRNWLITLNNRFFLGDDPVREEELRTAVIAPDTGEPVVEEPEVGTPAEDPTNSLTEQYGRQRYWTNTLDLLTSYDYGRDSTVSGGYTFDVLRNNESDDVGGYTDYDRHTGLLALQHRFNRRWIADGDFRYSRGLFDQPDIYVVTVPGEETTDLPVEQIAGEGSDDLSEYDFRLRGTYESSAHFHLFTEYSFMSTDYDAEIREDYRVNNLAFGMNYDFTPHLHVTLSGGPSWGAFENSPTETDYNAYGGITWDYLHGSLTFFAEKGYDQENFDGRRSGLTDYWQTGVSLDYQFTPDLTATVSASYTDNRRLQYPSPQTIVIVDDGQDNEDLLPEDFDQVEYTEKDYDAGLSLTYTFLRWYSVSSGYRYYKHDTDAVESGTGSYNEHRVFVQLAVTRELFRW